MEKYKLILSGETYRRKEEYKARGYNVIAGDFGLVDLEKRFPDKKTLKKEVADLVAAHLIQAHKVTPEIRGVKKEYDREAYFLSKELEW